MNESCDNCFKKEVCILLIEINSTFQKHIGKFKGRCFSYPYQQKIKNILFNCCSHYINKDLLLKKENGKYVRHIEGTVNSLSSIKRKAIYKALKEAKGNRSEAAKLLEIGERTLYRYIKELNIQSNSRNYKED